MTHQDPGNSVIKGPPGILLLGTLAFLLGALLLALFTDPIVLEEPLSELPMEMSDLTLHSGDLGKMLEVGVLSGQD
ncbi:MAG: hypothetical protein QNJ97_13650 [Myxococcota bacterium]|nr:hypothetical protein [Myxococcota bacterium]